MNFLFHKMAAVHDVGLSEIQNIYSSLSYVYSEAATFYLPAP